MLSNISLLRNVGQFDSVTAGAQIPFSKLTLIYAENGRGKTTLAAILRSLSSGEPNHILERHRLGATRPPHLVLNGSSGASVMFQDGAWSRNLPAIAVFDDVFVAENVCSGLEIETEHRQKLHELVLGTQGVSLSKVMQNHVDRIEEHNRSIRAKSDAIPAALYGSMSVDDFCALQKRDDIESAIQETRRSVSAAKAAEEVRQGRIFATLVLPELDTSAFESLLNRDLEQLEATAAAQVQNHLKNLGAGGEVWVGDGVARIISHPQNGEPGICPFCAQDLSASSVIAHYTAYFSAEYKGLRQAISAMLATVSTAHNGEATAAFERSVRIAVQTQQFWSNFTEVPQIEVDTAAIARAWIAALDHCLTALKAKLASPLEKLTLPAEAVTVIAEYNGLRDEVATLSSTLLQANIGIAIVKEKAATANVASLQADLARLEKIEARHRQETMLLCDAYLAEKQAKLKTEGLREQARANLEQHRKTVFPAYETAVNTYLPRFTAGFRLSKVISANTRGGSACTYHVLINNQSVSVAGNNPAGPSFRNTLSAGDRNTLALAFFFASLEKDPNKSQKIVVLDDPMCSLDEHRTLSTRQEVHRLLSEVEQVIVLSHSKPFLCALWENADRKVRSAIKIGRDGSGSTLQAWDVHQDCVTEHDKRHALLGDYMKTSSSCDERKVASALRPMLESFIRVAYPQQFTPGTLLGAFVDTCRRKKGTCEQVLCENDVVELDALKDFSNKFHHDTNSAWETEAINDTELVDFCRRTLNFTRRT